MTMRMKSHWILTGLATFAIVVASGGKAHAKGGIVANMGATQQIGDPTFEYLFDLELLAGSTISTGGFITIYDLPDLTSPFTVQPNFYWDAKTLFLGVDALGGVVTDNPNLYNVTWQWAGPALYTKTNLDLGTFIVGSTIELPTAPSASLVYVGSLNGITASNQGIVTINAVPEPSSVILLLTGLGALPIVWLRARRQRLSHRAA